MTSTGCAFCRWSPQLGRAALTGALLVGASPLVGAWPLGFVALVPLLDALERESWVGGLGRGLGLGLLSGLMLALPGHFWLIRPLAALSGTGYGTAVGLWLMLCLVQAAVTSVSAALVVAARHCDRSAVAATAVAFAATEAWYPFLLPTQFGLALHDVAPLAQLASLGGPSTLTFLLATSSALFAEALRDGGRRNAMVAMGVLLPCAIGLVGWERIRLVDEWTALAPSAVVAVVQGNVRPNDALTPSAVLRRHLKLSLEARERYAPELVVWSETVLTTQIRLEASRDGQLPRPTRLLGVPAMIGALVQDAEGHLHNSALLMDAHGALSGRYDKVHLAPIGEYLPLERWLPGVRSFAPAAGRLDRGSGITSVPWDRRRIGVAICYEDLMPEHLRSLVRLGQADFLVTLTNDAWFAGTQGPSLHFAHARLRAIELGRFVVRAASTGVSAIINPAGRIVASPPEDQEAVIAAPVALGGPRTVFARLGLWPWYLLSLTLGVAVLPRTRHSRSRYRPFLSRGRFPP